MTTYTFYIDSTVWGYHDYQSIWDNPVALEDGDLLREQETGNSSGEMHNLQAVAIKKTIDGGTLQVVGRVPRKISSVCLIFLRRGGSITLT